MSDYLGSKDVFRSAWDNNLISTASAQLSVNLFLVIIRAKLPHLQNFVLITCLRVVGSKILLATSISMIAK